MEEEIDNKPERYNSHPNGVECCEYTDYMGFNIGNAFKYLFRLGHKGERNHELGKAQWYVKRQYQVLNNKPKYILRDFEMANNLKPPVPIPPDFRIDNEPLRSKALETLFAISHNNTPVLDGLRYTNELIERMLKGAL